MYFFKAKWSSNPKPGDKGYDDIIHLPSKLSATSQLIINLSCVPDDAWDSFFSGLCLLLDIFTCRSPTWTTRAVYCAYIFLLRFQI